MNLSEYDGRSGRTTTEVLSINDGGIMILFVNAN